MKTFKEFSHIIVSPNDKPPLMDKKSDTVSYNILIPRELDNAVKEICEKKKISKSLFTRSTMKYWFLQNQPS
jgi:hypothetical protein